MSILSPIIRPLIRRELKKMIMKDLKPGAAILMQLIEKFGTKFVMGLAAIGGVGYLAYVGKIEGWMAVVGMVLVAISYFFARRMQEKAQEKTEDTEVTP